jgi:glutamate synthase (NADPH/NADH) small chain
MTPFPRPDRTPMPEQDPKVRATNFDEVPLGYTQDLAKREASRCLNCKKPQCVGGCPVSVNIPGFIKLLLEGKPVEAAELIKRTNCLPAVCGRVCPQESQCEAACILSKKGNPVAIGNLERYAADTAAKLSPDLEVTRPASNGRKIAVVGSGPAGLTCAGDLAKLGYAVTVFEAFHIPGGVLSYGIPPFRLPKEIVQREIKELEKYGVEFKLNYVIGKILPPDNLLQNFDAVFLGVGAGLPMFMDIPSENLGGIYTANEFLTRANLMKAYLFPEYDTPLLNGQSMCVIGGGNVAMDSARSALRLGAKEVRLIYRRSRAELPARAEESHHAEQEGVIFELLTNPIEYVGDEKGQVKEVVCERMELGEPDASGRRRPVTIPNSRFSIKSDMVIVAIGTSANPLLTSTLPDLKLNKRGYIISDANGKTSKQRVWAGGDIITGSATVILAMGAGRIAAKDIHETLSHPESPWPQVQDK